MFADRVVASTFRILLISVLAGLFGITANKTIYAAQSDANEISKARPTEVKVAAIQCSSTLGDVEGNRTKITALVKEAAKEGAKIIVLPEACITGYLSQDLRMNWLVAGKPIEPAFKGKNPAVFINWHKLLPYYCGLTIFSWDWIAPK